MRGTAEGFIAWAGGLILAALLLIPTTPAPATPAPVVRQAPITARYDKRVGPGPQVLVIRKGCLAAEDSADHLVVRQYEGGRTVIGCRSAGY